MVSCGHPNDQSPLHLQRISGSHWGGVNSGASKNHKVHNSSVHRTRTWDLSVRKLSALPLDHHAPPPPKELLTRCCLFFWTNSLSFSLTLSFSSRCHLEFGFCLLRARHSLFLFTCILLKNSMIGFIFCLSWAVGPKILWRDIFIKTLPKKKCDIRIDIMVWVKRASTNYKNIMCWNTNEGWWTSRENPLVRSDIK